MSQQEKKIEEMSRQIEALFELIKVMHNLQGEHHKALKDLDERVRLLTDVVLKMAE